MRASRAAPPLTKAAVLRRLLAACVVPLLTAGCGEREGAAPGFAAPEISALGLQDRRHRLSDYLGRVLVLNFWSRGSGASIAGMPHMDALYRQYGKDGLTVLGINRGEQPEAVAATVRGLRVTYPIAIDQLGVSARRYQVMAVPATFILDREGVLRERVLGGISRERLEALVTPLLGVAVTAPPPAANDAKAASSQAPPAAQETVVVSVGDAAAGRQLYRGLCRDCHGKWARKRAMGYSERLHDLAARRIEATLKKYQYATVTAREDRNKSGLSDREIQDLLTYLQDLKSGSQR